MNVFFTKVSKYSVFLTFFLDNIGLGVVFPIFSPLFLDPTYHFFQSTPTFAKSSFLLGVLIALFPLAQFFGAPLIGDLSDQIGRKKAFALTISGSLVGYIFLGLGIDLRSIPLLFFSRFITGLFAGNLTICLASLVDQSKDDQERTKNFSLLATIGGLSFICAILIGGFFSDPDLGKHFSPSLPFWIIAGLFLLNLCLMLLFFKESHIVPQFSHFNLLKGIHNILHAWELPRLKLAYMSFFFFVMAWTTSNQFLPAFLIKNYQVSSHDLMYIYLGNGIIWGGVNYFFSKVLSRTLTARETLLGSFFLLPIFLFLFDAGFSLPWFLMHFYFAVSLSAVSWTACLTNVSLQATEDIQGRVLGINQSFGALAAIIGPLLGGIIAGYSTKFIYICTGTFCLISFLILLSPSLRKTPL